MPYTKIWIHIIWTTKNREPMLPQGIRTKVFGHIRENARAKEIHLDSINGFVDHVHLLVRLKPDQSVAKIVQLLKGESSHWANKEKITSFRFEWQDEYIALSVSDSVVQTVRHYIATQEAHHQKKTLSEEYEEFLKQYGFDKPQSEP